MRLPALPIALLALSANAAGIPLYDYKQPLKDGLTVVGIECHKKNGTLEIGNFDASRPPDKRMDLWATWDLVRYNRNTSMVEQILEVEKRCNIGDDHYVVRFKGAPGNSNAMGQCGAFISAEARVTKNGKVLFDQQLEQCNDEAPIRTVRFSTGSDRPQIGKK